MSRAERDKGARGQRAVRALFEAHGWTMTATASTRRRIAGTCDYIGIRDGVVIAVEVKHQSVLRLPLWRRQTLANAPEGTLPVLVYRQPTIRSTWATEFYCDDRWLVSEAADFAENYVGP